MAASDHSPRRGRLAALAGSLALGTLLGLIACECALRVHLSHRVDDKAKEWHSLGRPVRSGSEVGLGHIIRPHAERRISYELIPELDVVFKGASVRTNAAGFRGSPTPPIGPPATGNVRILGLGDSVMFGWGVEYEECYMGLLERDLAEAHPALDIELINTAVPGYNTVMEVETLKVKGLAWQPDIVLIDHVSNDLMPPHFIPQDVDCWTPTRLFLPELIRSALRNEDFDPFQRFGRPPRLAEGRDFWTALEFDAAKVPVGLRDMVGLSSMQRAMRELAELSREQGFEVVVTTHQRAPQYLRKMCNELGFPLVEAAGVLRYMSEHEITDRRGTILTLSDVDPHPSPFAHRLQADAIMEYLSSGDSLRRAAGSRATD